MYRYFYLILNFFLSSLRNGGLPKNKINEKKKEVYELQVKGTMQTTEELGVDFKLPAYCAM